MLDWALRIIGVGGLATLFSHWSFSIAQLAQYEASVVAIAHTVFGFASMDMLNLAIVAGLALLCAGLALFYA
jgi:hypothetical protein